MHSRVITETGKGGEDVNGRLGWKTVGPQAADVLRHALEKVVVMVPEVSAGPCSVGHILVVEAVDLGLNVGGGRLHQVGVIKL